MAGRYKEGQGYLQAGSGSRTVPCCNAGKCSGYNGGDNSDYGIVIAYHTPTGFRLIGNDGRSYFTAYQPDGGFSQQARERMKMRVELNELLKRPDD